jgi:hypothetical protein
LDHASLRMKTDKPSIHAISQRYTDIISEFLAPKLPPHHNLWFQQYSARLRLKCDGTRAETRFRLTAKRTSPFKSVGTSVQSTTGRRAVHISPQGLYCSCKPVFCGHVTLTGYPLHLFPLHFSSHASPRAITFQLDSTSHTGDLRGCALPFVLATGGCSFW